MTIPPDRRRSPRIILQRSVKLQCALTGRYFAGQTRNISETGMLIDLDAPSLLVAGQELKISDAVERSTAMIRAADFRVARVVRALGKGKRQQVAVQFGGTAEAQSLSLAA